MQVMTPVTNRMAITVCVDIQPSVRRDLQGPSLTNPKSVRDELICMGSSKSVHNKQETEPRL